MRPLLPLLLLALGALPLDAQIVGLPRRSTVPSAWIAASVGFHDPNPVPDGGTGTTWDFGTGLQYRVSLEQARPSDAAIGLTGTYARMPLSHRGDPACATECDAHGDIWQALASFRLGGGQGFHQVIEFTLGVTHYRNFTADADGAALAPRDGDNDFTLGVSYGFGYGLSARTQLLLVQDFVTTMHQRDGLQGGTSNFVQQRTTRIGIRYGLGSRERF